jgi:hypothetical protein
VNGRHEQLVVGVLEDDPTMADLGSVLADRRTDLGLPPRPTVAPRIPLRCRTRVVCPRRWGPAAPPARHDGRRSPRRGRGYLRVDVGRPWTSSRGRHQLAPPPIDCGTSAGGATHQSHAQRARRGPGDRHTRASIARDPLAPLMGTARGARGGWRAPATAAARHRTRGRPGRSTSAAGRR